jgi:hypothetical protein
MRCHWFCLAIVPSFVFVLSSDLGDTFGAPVSRPFHVAGCTCNLCDKCCFFCFVPSILGLLCAYISNLIGMSLRPAEGVHGRVVCFVFLLVKTGEGVAESFALLRIFFS